MDASIERVTPRTAEEAAGALAAANGAGQAVIPTGHGTKLAWGGTPARTDVVLFTGELSRVVEHAADDMTVTVEAGCTIAALQATVGAHAQRLALDPLWPERATVGGVLATNDAGALRQRYGSARDQLIGVTLALPDGTIAKSGGKVVKNVAGYDLCKLAIGSFGTLAVILEATFRLYPRPRAVATVTIGGSVDVLATLALAIARSTLVATGVQLRAGSGQEAALDVRLEGVSAGIEAQQRALADLARGAVTPAGEATWLARAALFDPAPSRVVARFAVLPASVAAFVAAVEQIAAAHGATWSLVAQGVGAGHLRLEGEATALAACATSVRESAQREQGSLVILDAPGPVRAAVDAWGDPGDAFPVMQRLKEALDPRRTLSPGRFVGGL